MRLRKKKGLLDQAGDYVDSVRPHVESAVHHAVDAVGDFVEHTARPAIADARDKAGPAIADARAKAAPLVASAAELAAEKASAAKDVADARVAQLKGEPQKKKGSKLKKLVLFAGLAGAVAFVAKKLQGKSEADNWQSSYVPTPPTAKAAPTPEPVADDAAGASPDEALSDLVDEPHDATTPDAPVEVVDLEERKND